MKKGKYPVLLDSMFQEKMLKFSAPDAFVLENYIFEVWKEPGKLQRVIRGDDRANNSSQDNL